MTIVAAILVAVLLAPPPVRGADGAHNPIETVKDERLTGKVNNVSLENVILRFAVATGAEIRGSVLNPHEVSVEFEDVSIQDGLARLLGDQNFMLTYSGAKLTRVTLMGGAVDEAVTKVVKNEHPNPGEPAPTFAQLLQTRMIQVSPGGRLARFLDKNEASLQQLVDIGLRNEDAAVRTEAMRMAIQAIDGQPDLNAATIAAINGMDDNQLMALFRATARDNTRAVLAQMSTLLRTNDLRQRSLKLLMQANAPLGADQPAGQQE
jgi:hypothetical protein